MEKACGSTEFCSSNCPRGDDRHVAVFLEKTEEAEEAIRCVTPPLAEDVGRSLGEAATR